MGRLAVVDRNADLGVTWVHSYVTSDKTKTYCIYDGPESEAIRQAAERNGLPVDHITDTHSWGRGRDPSHRGAMAQAGTESATGGAKGRRRRAVRDSGAGEALRRWIWRAEVRELGRELDSSGQTSGSLPVTLP